MVHWGTCHFLEKARIAQTGGAEALLVANNSVLVSYKTTRGPVHGICAGGRGGGAGGRVSAQPIPSCNPGPLACLPS